MAQQQRRGPRQSPPSPLVAPASHSGSSSSHSSHQPQYADYTPALQQQLRSPATPMHPEDTRLLAGFASQPASPHDLAASEHRPVRTPSASAAFAPSPLNPAPALPQQQGQLFAPQSENPFAGGLVSPAPSNPAAAIGVSRAGTVTPNTPSRPVSRGSVSPFPAYNINNPASPSSHPGSPVRFGSSAGGVGAADEGVFATLGLGPNSSGFPSAMGAKGAGSMVLYRLADDPRASASSHPRSTSGASSSGGSLFPPRFPGSGSGGASTPPSMPMSPGNRLSYASTGGDADSILSFAESKYPLTGNAGGMGGGGSSSVRGLIPYVYDPMLDENEPLDEEDLLHDPNPKAYLSGKYQGVIGRAGAGGKGSKLAKGGGGGSGGGKEGRYPSSVGLHNGRTIWEKKHFPWRGVLNIGVLVVLVLGMLCLFAFYPILTFYRDAAKNNAIEGNIRINATGQASVLFQMPDPIDTDTPQSARARTGFDGQEYELVFSDEFEKPGRTFWPGDDPFWEAVDLWYGATQDQEWYDPQQVTTRDGALVITIDSTATTQGGITPGSTAPFTEADNHGLTYRSGMLQTWNKFCFTTGYIEVSATFPGPDQQTQGYWPGAWTMGNLARPGYPATTDGLWPYTYDSCDIGTFPNQTNPDGQTPAVAVHSDASRPNYNYALSWLPGQRLSACSCPGSDHPGPDVTRGRGSPEIDIFEAERDKNFDVGHVVSQSAQFAPFSADYLYSNASGGWTNFDATRTRANTYRGSAIQQSVSGLTRLPTDMFQGSGANFKTFGFEYWSDPQDRNAGTITWQVDGQKTHRVIANAVGPDTGDEGSGVGQRIIPEEPMSIVLNLGISSNWQKIDLSSMLFPGEMKIDYVRVYQRKGQTNTGCDPKNYPTADYINSHLEAYTDVNMTSWKWEKPKNSKYDGC